MAKNASFSSRFPYAKLFLLLAVLIAIPLTVWSAQNKTNTEQHAATGYTCTTQSSFNYCSPETCAPNKSVSGTCAYGRRCCQLIKLSPPYKVIVGSGAVKNATPKTAEVIIMWTDVENASGYDVYYKIVPGTQEMESYKVLSNTHGYKTQGENSRYIKIFTNWVNSYAYAYVVTRNGSVKSNPSVVVSHKINRYTNPI